MEVTFCRKVYYPPNTPSTETLLGNDFCELKVKLKFGLSYILSA